MLKDRWNGEVEGLVRRAQTIDWNEMRDGVEKTVEGGWRRLSGGK